MENWKNHGGGLEPKAGNFKDPTRPDSIGVNATRVWGTED